MTDKEHMETLNRLVDDAKQKAFWVVTVEELENLLKEVKRKHPTGKTLPIVDFEISYSGRNNAYNIGHDWVVQD